MTQTWWLSFGDGEQFLGAAIVDVTDREAAAAEMLVAMRRAANRLPPVEHDAASWIAAAILKAHHAGCNPGGDVLSVRIDEAPEFAGYDAKIPRDRLLSGPDLEALDIGAIATVESMSQKRSQT